MSGRNKQLPCPKRWAGKNTADCWFLRSHVGPEWRMVEDLQVASDYADHNRKVQEPKLQRRQFGFQAPAPGNDARGTAIEILRLLKRKADCASFCSDVAQFQLFNLFHEDILRNTFCGYQSQWMTTNSGFECFMSGI